MKLKTRNNLLIYVIPTVIALLARVSVLYDWWSLPVRWYSNIGGLDMSSILEVGTGFYDGKGVFTLYSVILGIILLLNNSRHSPETMVIIQLLIGIIICPLTAWCAFKLWGKAYWAAASGIIAALYAPAIMYQVLILKETVMLLFALLALAAVFRVHKRNFSSGALWICGIFLALPCMSRISALPFCGLASLWILAASLKKTGGGKKALISRAAFIMLGILTVFIPASIYNFKLSGGTYFLPVQAPVKYIAKLGAIIKPATLNLPADQPQAKAVSTITTPKPAPKNNFIVNMLRKAPAVFSASEIPNNVNYYFLKYKLFPLQYLIGPLFLIPLAITALILLILNRGIFRKESILFIFIFSYILPLCFFVPLARYRLIMTPVFCMLAPYPFFAAWKSYHSSKRFPALLPFVIWAIVLYINLPVDNFLRASDFVSYGKGIQYQSGKSAAALPYFYKAYEMAPYKQMTIVNLAETLLNNRKPAEAGKILLPAFQKDPANPAYRYYLGVASLYTGKPRQAEHLFSGIKPESMHNLIIQYYYYFGESLRSQKKYEAATKLYKEAIKFKPDKRQRILLERSLKDCYDHQ